MRRKYRVHHTSNRLRILRAERRWTQAEVARRLGMATKFRYWEIENEEVVPTGREVRLLARMFNVSERAIFPNLKRVTANAA